MPEIEIKRVNFFDGQFLKELEFQEEQKYHLHMRRRLNYILFNQSGVIRVNPNDLEVEVPDSTSKDFLVRAGMAISKDDNLMEGKEIILKQDETINLDTVGISPGQTAFVTIHYEEVSAKDPPSEGDEDKPTRVKENAVIKVHSDSPAGLRPENGEEYILLGIINYDDMEVDNSRKQLAVLNNHLVGRAPVTLVSIEVIPAAASIEDGGTLQFTAIGNFSDGSQRDLGAGDGLAWESNNNSIVKVVDGLATGVSLGVATITASAMNKSATASVDVVESPPEIVSIEITPASPTVTEGDHITLTATGTFREGPPRTLASGEVTWTTDSNSIAKVNDNGRVTGMSAAGPVNTANITATSTKNSTISDTVSVRVDSAVAAPVIDNYSPRRGTPGTEVTIEGRNLTGAMVTFDGVNAAILTGSSDSKIKTEVPVVASNQAGKLRVSNDGGFAEKDFNIRAS